MLLVGLASVTTSVHPTLTEDAFQEARIVAGKVRHGQNVAGLSVRVVAHHRAFSITKQRVNKRRAHRVVPCCEAIDRID
jgi:hypothetical protein